MSVSDPIPYDDIIHSGGDNSLVHVDAVIPHSQFTQKNCVWLGPHACLMQASPALVGEELPVVHVVGVTDSQTWVGSVLLLD